MGFSLEKEDNISSITLIDDEGKKQYTISVLKDEESGFDDDYINDDDLPHRSVTILQYGEKKTCIVHCSQKELQLIFTMLQEIPHEELNWILGEESTNLLINTIKKQVTDMLEIDYVSIERGLQNIGKTLGKKIVSLEKKKMLLGSLRQRIKSGKIQLRQVSAKHQLQKIVNEKDSSLVQEFVRLHRDYVDGMQKKDILGENCYKLNKHIQKIQLFADIFDEQIKSPKIFFRKKRMVEQFGHKRNGSVNGLKTIIIQEKDLYKKMYQEYGDVIGRLHVQQSALENKKEQLKDTFFSSKEKQTFNDNKNKILLCQEKLKDQRQIKQQYEEDKNNVTIFYVLKKNQNNIDTIKSKYIKLIKKQKNSMKKNNDIVVQPIVYSKKDNIKLLELYAIQKACLQTNQDTFGVEAFEQYQGLIQKKSEMIGMEYNSKLERTTDISLVNTKIAKCLQDVKKETEGIGQKQEIIEKILQGLQKEIKRRQQVNKNRLHMLEENVVIIAENGISLEKPFLTKEQKEKMQQDIIFWEEEYNKINDDLPYVEQNIYHKMNKILVLCEMYIGYKDSLQEKIFSLKTTYQKIVSNYIEKIEQNKDQILEIQKNEVAKTRWPETDEWGNIISDEQPEIIEVNVLNDDIKKKYDRDLQTIFDQYKKLLHEYESWKKTIYKYFSFLDSIEIKHDLGEKIQNLKTKTLLDDNCRISGVEGMNGNKKQKCKRQGVNGGHRSQRDYENGI